MLDSNGVAAWRKRPSAEYPSVSVAAVTMPASAVNATRSKVLTNSGPPGKYANTQMKASAVASAITPVNLLMVQPADFRSILFDPRRLRTAETNDVSARQIKIRIATVVTIRIVGWEGNG